MTGDTIEGKQMDKLMRGAWSCEREATTVPLCTAAQPSMRGLPSKKSFHVVACGLCVFAARKPAARKLLLGVHVHGPVAVSSRQKARA
jgi:hypothetical protein